MHLLPGVKVSCTKPYSTNERVWRWKWIVLQTYFGLRGTRTYVREFCSSVFLKKATLNTSPKWLTLNGWIIYTSTQVVVVLGHSTIALSILKTTIFLANDLRAMSGARSLVNGFETRALQIKYLKLKPQHTSFLHLKLMLTKLNTISVA